MKVRTLKPGYHDNKLRTVGEIFELKAFEGLSSGGKTKIFSIEDQFSSKWMEKADGRRKIGEPKEFSVEKDVVY